MSRSLGSSSGSSSTSPFLECPECQEEFDTSIRLPCVGSCGHSICAVCRRISRKCNECGIISAFSIETTNFVLKRIIDEREREKKATDEVEEVTCRLCLKKFSDDACVICLCEALDKDESSAEALISQIANRAMCSNCAPHAQQHIQHDKESLYNVKSFLRSMEVQKRMLELKRRADERLKEFDTATTIARRSYKNFFKVCIRKQRMTGDAKKFDSFADLVDRKAKDLDNVFTGRLKNLYIVARQAEKAKFDIKREKVKRLAKTASSEEKEKYGLLLRRLKSKETTEEIVSGRPAELVTPEEWKELSPSMRCTKADDLVSYYTEKMAESPEARRRTKKSTR